MRITAQGTENEEKCEQNLTWTLAVSLTLLDISHSLSFFLFFLACLYFPIPRARSRYPFLVLVSISGILADHRKSDFKHLYEQ